MPAIKARCPECGLRVEVSEREHRLIDPSSRCTHKNGWSRCPISNPPFPKHARIHENGLEGNDRQIRQRRLLGVVDNGLWSPARRYHASPVSVSRFCFGNARSQW